MIWYINALFVLLMVTLTIIDVRSFGTIRHRDFKSIIISTGILGTFFGIFWGLQGFDTTQIQDSVPHLLDGLKVAFFTSIAGMGLAIAISIYQKLQARKSDTEENIDYILEQVSHLDLLQNLNHLDKLHHLSAIEEGQKNTVAALQQFQSQQENQHTHLLESLQGSFSQTHSVLREAVEQLARGASEELIAALERVIQDFNQNLTDQFGDNFKKLNAAVGNMIEWQEHYRSSIEEIEKALRATQKSMHQSEKTLETIAGRNSEVMATYEQLGDILSAHKQQTQDLSAHLQTFATLSDNSQAMFKRLDDGFQSVSGNFSTLLQQANEQGSELSGLIRTKVTDLHESFEYFAKTSTDRMNALQLTLEKTAQVFQGTMQKNVHDALSLQQEHTKGLQASHQEHSQNLLNTHEAHNTALQEKLQQQYEWLNTQADENLKNLTEHVTQTHTTLTGHSQTLLDTHDAHNTAFQEKLRQQHEWLNAQANKNLKHLTEHVAQTHTALTGHSQNLLNTHEAHHTALQEKLQQQYGWLNTQVNESLKNLATQFTQTQTSLANELQTRAQTLQEGFSAQLSQALQQMTEAVKTGSGTQQELMAGITERFTALQQHLNTLLESISQALQDSTQSFLSTAQQNLNGLTQSCQQSFQAIEQQSTQSFAQLTAQISQQTGQSLKEIGDHATQSHTQLQALTQSLQQSQQNTAAFTEKLSVQIQQHFDASRGHIEQGLQVTEQQLGATLQNIQQATAQNMGQMSESVVKNLESTLKELESKLLVMQQQVLKNNSRLSTEYLKFLQTQIKESGELPKQITGSLKTSLESMQQLLESHFQKSADQIEHHRSTLSQVIDQTSRHFERELQHAGSMNTELNRSLTDLNQALSQMTNQFRIDYEWFLQRVRELMGNRGY